MSLSGTSGLDFSFSDDNGLGSGSGTDDSTMTFRGTVADINAALNGLVFSPTPGYHGDASIDILSDDLGGNSSGSPLAAEDLVDITVNLVNHAPTGNDVTVTAPENGGHTFSYWDFGFYDANDTPANNFLAVKITTLPGAGSLTDNGVAVTAGQFVSVAEVNNGQLVFTPASGVWGSAYASLTFQVQDDGGTAIGGVDLDPSAKTMTIDVGLALANSDLVLGINSDGTMVNGVPQGAVFAGSDFFSPGTPLEDYTVAANSQDYTNWGDGGYAAFPTTLTDESTGSVHTVVITGTVVPGLQFTRTISFNDANWTSSGGYVTITTTLTNTGSTSISDVAFLENADPDQDWTSTSQDFNTLNDVVDSGTFVRATGPVSGLTVGFGSVDSRETASASGFFNFDPFAIIDSPQDPNGASADIAIELAFNFGTIATGDSASATSFMVFGTSASTADSVFAAAVTTTTGLVDNGPTESVVGNSVSFTVNTTNVPNGATVSLKDADNGNAVVGSVTISGNTGSTTISNLSIGTHDIFAAYAGDGTHLSSQSSDVGQTVDPIELTSVIVNGDYAPIEGMSESGSTVTAVTDGNNGFTAGNEVIISGYTGANIDYNGDWTVASVSGNTFTYTDTNATGLPTLTFNSVGYAISTNSTSALQPGLGTTHQRSMVDSIAYTFNTPVNVGSTAVTLGLESGVTTSGAPLSTAVPNGNWTSLNGGTIWVLTFSSATGNTVAGHSIADGVYTATFDNTQVTGVADSSVMTTTRGTDVFYRLFGDFNPTAGSSAKVVNGADTTKYVSTLNLLYNGGNSAYLSYYDFTSDGRVNADDTTNYDARLNTVWSGFTPTI